MDYNQFKQLAKEEYTAIPVHRTLMADTVTPVSLFLKLREGNRYPFLFESVEGGEHLARYSFLGCNPYQVLDYKDQITTLTLKGKTGEILEGNFYDILKSMTGNFREPELPNIPRLTGGAVGYSAYDTVRMAENLPNVPDDDLHLPEAIWAFYDEIYAFDHVKHRIILIKTVFTDNSDDLEILYHNAHSALDSMEKNTKIIVKEDLPFSISGGKPESNTSRDEFCQKVLRAKEYIKEGDIFQVVLSQRFKTNFEGDRFMLYRALRMVNPSPYLFYLEFHDFSLVGSSPEVLVRVLDGEAQVLPIAGTRPRGATTEEDLAYEQDLVNDPKEVAEHIMLVDLGRNDLSRICEPKTVKMQRNQVIERYSHVMHIVSDVSGRLSKGKHPIDALIHCFPAGTVSGAPKIRAMEIIDELETTKRGPYAGAVGYIDFSGNMDTCIAIRTMVATENAVYIQAGAGIVADSIPENEYEETVNKAKALVEALDLALEV
ncbi:MAG: anthranilate synthase component I [Balneolales bacterium]